MTWICTIGYINGDFMGSKRIQWWLSDIRIRNQLVAGLDFKDGPHVINLGSVTMKGHVMADPGKLKDAD